MVYVVEVLIVIQYSVLVVRSGYTRSVGSMYKVMKTFVEVARIMYSVQVSVDIGASANLELVD